MFVSVLFLGVLLVIFFRHTLLQSEYKVVLTRQQPCNCVTGSAAPATEPPTAPPTKVQVVHDKPDTPVLPSVFLLIMVPMRPVSFSVRKLIRSTWYSGYKDSPDIMLRFLVGTKNLSAVNMKLLNEEQSRHGDIVYCDLHESYKALTNKTIEMLKWSHEHINFTYLMKCDDDTFVYVDLLVSELRKRPKTTGLYYGRIEYNSPVLRDPKYEWFDPDWDLAATYMPYAIGGGYILSWDLVGMLARQASYLKWHPNEDTAVGSWLAPYKYERRSDHLFCVTSVFGTLKHKCAHFPLFHIFYTYPAHHNQTSYFHYLYNEYITT